MRRWQRLLFFMAALISLGAHIPASAALPPVPEMSADCMETRAGQQQSDDGSQQDEKGSPLSCMTALGCSMPATALDDPVIPSGPNFVDNGFDIAVFTELLGASRAPETHPPTYLG